MALPPSHKNLTMAKHLGLAFFGFAAAALASSWDCAKTCTVSSRYAASNGTADDSPAIIAALAACADGGIVIFSQGVDYNALTPISATNLSNVTIQLSGNLHLPKNITYIQSLVNASSSGNLYWFTFAGPGINWQGTPDPLYGWIYSYGQGWWDANKYPSTGLASRPHLMSFNTTHGSMNYYKSRQPIAWNVQLIGSDIEVKNTFIDAFSSTGSFPFNTDGFDVTGTNIAISDATIFNGDDAIAVQSGSHNVTFRRGTIGYQSHGMSIGSLGQNQADFANVSNIHFDDVTVIDAVYASRFKSWEGGQGLASNISWTNIRVYNVTFPIFVTQTYLNQGSKQTQSGNGATQGRPNNATVNMENLTWANFTGTINTFKPGDGSCASNVSIAALLHRGCGYADDVTQPCWYNVGLPNLTHTETTIVECNTAESCKDFTFKNIDVVPQTLARPKVICFNATAELNPKLGFDCANGTYIPTDY